MARANTVSLNKGVDAMFTAADRVLQRSKEPNLLKMDFEQPPAHFHEGQLEAWLSEVLDVVVCAGTQGGKTEFLIYWFLREIARCAEWVVDKREGKFLVVGPRLQLMQQQLIPTFERVFVEEYQLGKLTGGNNPKFTFSPSGCLRVFGDANVKAVVSFGYASSSNNIESITALACIWDESGQADNKVSSYYACNRRLKVGRSNGMGRRAFGTTPYEWNWFKVKVHDKAMNKQEGFELFRFASWMNPIVEREQIEADLTVMPLWKWEMMYLGLFRKPAGVIFDCFEALYRDSSGKPLPPEVFRTKGADVEMVGGNVCKPFTIPDGWRHVTGHDFGTVNMAAVFGAQDPMSGIVYIYAAYLRPGEEAATHAKNFMALAKTKTVPRAWGGTNGEEKWREDFAKAGYPIEEPPGSGPGSLLLRINRMYGLYKRRMFVIFSNLDKLIDDVESYSWELDDNDQPVEGKIEEKATWHRIDAKCYLACALYEGLAEPVKSNPDKRYSRGEETTGPKMAPTLEERMRAATMRRR